MLALQQQVAEAKVQRGLAIASQTLAAELSLKCERLSLRQLPAADVVGGSGWDASAGDGLFRSGSGSHSEGREYPNACRGAEMSPSFSGYPAGEPLYSTSGARGGGANGHAGAGGYADNSDIGSSPLRAGLPAGDANGCGDGLLGQVPSSSGGARPYRTWVQVHNAPRLLWIRPFGPGSDPDACAGVAPVALQRDRARLGAQGGMRPGTDRRCLLTPVFRFVSCSPRPAGRAFAADAQLGEPHRRRARIGGGQPGGRGRRRGDGRAAQGETKNRRWRPCFRD